MELVLVRHGLPERVEVETGTADPPLSTLGRKQADLVAEWLIGERIDAVYASPMQRAYETAQPYAALAGKEITIEEGVI